jgi:protein-S-isoprenylcysteine O-methyltransferase Ste14
VQGVRRRPGGVKRDRGSYFLVVLSLAAGRAITAFSVSIPGAMIGGQPVPFVIGLVLVWCGILLRAWAFRTLGRYFTFRVETSADQPVISTSPYRVLRDPGYSALLLILVGVSLLYGTWIGLAAMLIVPTAGLVVRIRVEAALETDLGQAHRSYAASRKRLIPYIW